MHEFEMSRREARDRVIVVCDAVVAAEVAGALVGDVVA